MAYDEFPAMAYISQSSKAGRTYPTLMSQFGDGYFQAATDGMHSVIRKWDVALENIPFDVYLTVVAFLDAKGRRTPFLMAMPNDAGGTRQWRNTGDVTETVMSGNVYSLAFSVVEDFSLGS